ncbi:MAG: CYTH domain-containing protein [Chloroflexota bacterium]
MSDAERGVIERERKYRLSDTGAGRLRARLERDGRAVRSERQETIVLRDRASRLEKGAYLRFRTVGGRSQLTLKGPKHEVGKDKWRVEHTLGLADGPALELLAAMGFEPGTRYVKDTAIFVFRTVVVSVDRLAGVGRFCEIETDELEKDLDAVAEALDLRDEDLERRGYPRIAQSAQERVGARS